MWPLDDYTAALPLSYIQIYEKEITLQSHMSWFVSTIIYFSVVSITLSTAIFLQTSRFRHVSVTVWETRHIKTIRPVQNRGLT